MLSSLVRPSNRIYPLFSIIFSVLIFIVGLFLVKESGFLIYLGSVIALYIIFGYSRAMFKVLMIIVPMSFFAGLVALIGANYVSAFQTSLRFFSFGLSTVLSLSIEPVDLVRSLNDLKFPRVLTLGLLITLRFISIISDEMKRIKIAMKTRGVNANFFNLKMLYRAFVIPLISRVISISDTLTISLETRYFGMHTDHTVYKPVKLKGKDYLFAIILILSFALNFYFKNSLDPWFIG